jgi:hypothetical protein
VGRLHHRGETAQALLTEMINQSNGNNGFGQSTSGHSVYLVRVEPDGGTPFESQLLLRGYMGLSGHRLLDRWVQVCYDAKAPARCEIDRDWVNALPRGVLMPMNLRQINSGPKSTRRARSPSTRATSSKPLIGCRVRSRKGRPAELTRAHLRAAGRLPACG